MKLNRIDRWYGGIVTGDKDKKDGGCLNAEELDIFSNPDYVQPETVLSADTSITTGTYGVYGFTTDKSNNLYAISDDAAGTPKVKIWKLSSAAGDNPGDFAAYKTSAYNARASGYANNIIWHAWGSPITNSYLYYIGGTNSLIRLGDIEAAGTTEATTDSGATTMTITGLTAATKYVPFKRVNAELFIGAGQYISKVDSDGVFTDQAFTIPNEWEIVDFDGLGDELYILARNVRSGDNSCKIFIWDKVSLQTIEDEIMIPMGGPQTLFNHNEVMRVICAQNNKLRIYELVSLVPVKTHEIACRTDLAEAAVDGFVASGKAVFSKNNIIYIGMAGTLVNGKNAGLWAIGKTEDSKPLALVLAKRFINTNATGTKVHTPLAAIAVGPNIYTSYKDYVSTAAYKLLRVEENNSPARSSSAIYESIWIDAGMPEHNKSWPGMMVVARAMPASCSVKFDATMDNSSSVDSVINADSSFTLSSSNDQVITGNIADRFWQRNITSLHGRRIQIKLTFTSNSTDCAQLYSVSILSDEGNLI